MQRLQRARLVVGNESLGDGALQSQGAVLQLLPYAVEHLRRLDLVLRAAAHVFL
jgi:hypothetical protein